MATKYYPQNTNADTTCDYGTGTPHDLATSAGTPTTHYDDVSKVVTFTVIRTYQLNIGTGLMASSDNINFSISLNTVNLTDVRWWVWYVDASCNPVGVSGYSSTYTTSGIKTGSLTMGTLSGTPVHIELLIEAQENLNHGTRDVTIDVQSSNTWIEGPWGTGASGVKTGSVL